MLELLLMMFIAMTVVGGLGIAFMYLSKSEKGQKIWFYGMAIFALFVAMVSYTSLPSNFMMEKGITLVVGALAVAGVIARVKISDQANKLPKHLVAASIVLGLGYLFLG